jgi:hypothetical protein
VGRRGAFSPAGAVKAQKGGDGPETNISAQVTFSLFIFFLFSVFHFKFQIQTEFKFQISNTRSVKTSTRIQEYTFY